MKTFKYLSLVATTLSLVACQEASKDYQEITINEVSISNSKPMQGDSLSLAFTTEEEVNNIILHYSTKEKTYMQDLEVNHTGNIVKTSFRVPDSATSMAFDFMKKYKPLNDAVSLPVYSEEGLPLPGAMIGQGMYFKSMGKALGHKIEADSILSLYRTDLTTYPELKEEHEMAFAELLVKAKDPEGEDILKKRAAALITGQELSLEELKALNKVYFAIGNRAKIDSLNTLMAEKFADSDPAIAKKFNEIQQMTDLEEKEKAAKAFMAAHPDHRTAQYMASSLAQSYGRAGAYDKFNNAVQNIEDPASRGRALNSVAWRLAEKGEDLENAAQISKTSIDVIEQAIATPKWDPASTTKTLNRMALENSLKMYYDTYALILFKQGDLKEAIRYQEMAAGVEASGEVNEKYIQYLIEDKQYAMAKEKASEFMIHNVSTPKMTAYLETAFEAEGGEGNYADFVAALQAEAKENLKEEIMKKMLNEEAAGFTLKNIEGGEIALADLKGKTVVLDFWATWCGPCKASFPGMQKALNNYEKNENVVFLFIDTFERGTDEKRIEMTGEFIEKNNYNFTVLLDAMNEKSGNFKVADDYGVTGIPTKVIIGPDGNIKFKSVGWSGSVDKLVNELDMMIELAQS